MGAVIERAEQIVTQLKDADLSASADVRKLKVPGLLVIPVPTLAFTVLDNSSVEATFKVFAIGSGLGDLKTAGDLEDLVLKAAEVLLIESAEPGSYQLPGGSDPSPAYELTLSTDVLDVTT